MGDLADYYIDCILDPDFDSWRDDTCEPTPTQRLFSGMNNKERHWLGSMTLSQALNFGPNEVKETT